MYEDALSGSCMYKNRGDKFDSAISVIDDVSRGSHHFSDTAISRHISAFQLYHNVCSARLIFEKHRRKRSPPTFPLWEDVST